MIVTVIAFVVVALASFFVGNVYGSKIDAEVVAELDKAIAKGTLKEKALATWLKSKL